MDEGSVMQVGKPLVTKALEIPKFNRDELILAIRADQSGNTTFPEFYSQHGKPVPLVMMLIC
jgi:uncharacterized protein YbcV (DUF1398 family)